MFDAARPLEAKTTMIFDRRQHEQTLLLLGVSWRRRRWRFPAHVTRLGARAVCVPKRLVAETRVLEVNGQLAKVFRLAGPDGRPGIRLAPGERFRVDGVQV